MERIRPQHEDKPLHGVEASKRIEQYALNSSEPHALMRRAGSAVAALVRAISPHASSVWVACGPGNNGGDGLEAARCLHDAGMRVTVTLASGGVGPPADARDALARAQSAGLTISTEYPSDADVAIDALLGLGSNRAPQGEVAAAIDRLNALARPLLAIDLPSGLNADTGQPHGEQCVSATHTLALLTLKPGLFTGAGRDHAGSVWLDTLGIDTSASPSTALLAAAGSPPATRKHAQHKGSFGDVAVIGGASGMAGAALLAARAAHAAGAGRVYVNLLDAHAAMLDAQRPELMFRPTWWQGSPDALRQATVVCGCGGSNAVNATLPRVLSLAGRLVLDADALNAISTDTSLQHLLAARHTRGRETVLTPHPLEAARMLGITASAVQADRLCAAQQLADRFGTVVVLKGSGTVIAAPGAVPLINLTGNAALSTAGTGDVLAGWLGGWWSASGMSAQQAARQAVWLHGHAADLHPIAPLRAANLIEAMHAASL